MAEQKSVKVSMDAVRLGVLAISSLVVGGSVYTLVQPDTVGACTWTCTTPGCHGIHGGGQHVHYTCPKCGGGDVACCDDVGSGIVDSHGMCISSPKKGASCTYRIADSFGDTIHSDTKYCS